MPLPTDEREITLQKTERVYVKLSLGMIGALCLLVAVCWGGRRIYVRWQEHKLMQQAHVAFDKTDFRWAALAAQRAYSLDPSSHDACRTLATIAERQNAVEAIEWRRRALAIDPTSLPDRLALANTALRFNQPAISAEALAKVPPAEQGSADYHSAAAHLALVQNKLSEAGEHLRAAARFTPEDLHRQLELAEFQLRSDDQTQRENGLTRAMQLKSDSKVRLDAVRVLLNDALRRRYDSESIALAKELDAIPDAPLADRLLALGILRNYNDPAFTGALTRLQGESSKSAERAVRLIGWMNTHGLALLAIDWSKSLPPEMLESIGLRFALADSYVQLRDWTALRDLLGHGGWDQAEPLRLALEAKVARETGDDDGFEKSWAAAVAKAENNKERLKILQTLAFQWHWSEKGVAVLWLMAENPGQQEEALQGLYRFYAGARDTAGLYRTLTRLVEVMPNDPMVKNNYAQISLLLHAQPAQARELARYVHQEQPKNAAFASTYAFALYQNGDNVGALTVMQSLTSEQLAEPSVAAYYGVFLAAAGKADEAAKYLKAAEKANLLPEEEKLVAGARTSLTRGKRDSGT